MPKLKNSKSHSMGSLITEKEQLAKAMFGDMVFVGAPATDSNSLGTQSLKSGIDCHIMCQDAAGNVHTWFSCATVDCSAFGTHVAAAARVATISCWPATLTFADGHAFTTMKPKVAGANWSTWQKGSVLRLRVACKHHIAGDYIATLNPAVKYYIKT